MYFYLMKIGILFVKCAKFGSSSREYPPISFHF